MKARWSHTNLRSSFWKGTALKTKKFVQLNCDKAKKAMFPCVLAIRMTYPEFFFSFSFSNCKPEPALESNKHFASSKRVMEQAFLLAPLLLPPPLFTHSLVPSNGRAN
jgi:hypothetical protein